MNEELLRLWESEFHPADIVWENEPVQSSELVRLCNEKSGLEEIHNIYHVKKIGGQGSSNQRELNRAFLCFVRTGSTVCQPEYCGENFRWFLANDMLYKLLASMQSFL